MPALAHASPAVPCSLATPPVCEQFATPLLLLEFSPGDLAAPCTFGLSVFLLKVRRRRPSTHTPGPPCCRCRCLRLRLHHSFCPCPHPALRAHTLSSTHGVAAHPPRSQSLLPSWQFALGPMCGSWMDRAERRLVIRWGIGLQCAGVSLALCTLPMSRTRLRLSHGPGMAPSRPLQRPRMAQAAPGAGQPERVSRFGRPGQPHQAFRRRHARAARREQKATRWRHGRRRRRGRGRASARGAAARDDRLWLTRGPRRDDLERGRQEGLGTHCMG
jgi:hypothetical protein